MILAVESFFMHPSEKWPFIFKNNSGMGELAGVGRLQRGKQDSNSAPEVSERGKTFSTGAEGEGAIPR